MGLMLVKLLVNKYHAYGCLKYGLSPCSYEDVDAITIIGRMKKSIILSDRGLLMDKVQISKKEKKKQIGQT